MLRKDCLDKCVRIALGFWICEGDKVIVKVGRELFMGTITAVTPIALMLDDSIIVKHSKLAWIKFLERGCQK